MEVIKRLGGAEKKLVDYLKPGLKVCLAFNHGIGDTVMFQPIYETLKRMYPDVSWNLRTFTGQQEVWNDGTDNEVDYIFEVHYYEPWLNHSQMKKPEFCCWYELGIPYDEVPEQLSPPPKADFASPLVAVAYQSTSCGYLTIKERAAYGVWDGVIQAGLVPIEAHYIHKYHNPRNQMYRCVTATVRPCKPTLGSLIGLLKSCRAAIGCDSGMIYLAMSLGLPTLHLENARSVGQWYLHNPPCSSIKEDDVTSQAITDWLNSLRA